MIIFLPGGVIRDDGTNLELSELFCSLGSLIVEGRLPAGAGAGGTSGGGRGYYEGPHVELPGKISRHKCSPIEYLVSTRVVVSPVFTMCECG